VCTRELEREILSTKIIENERSTGTKKKRWAAQVTKDPKHGKQEKQTGMPPKSIPAKVPGSSGSRGGTICSNRELKGGVISKRWEERKEEKTERAREWRGAGGGQKLEGGEPRV